MSHTTIDIDDRACAAVMRCYGLATKQEAVNFALRNIALEPLTLDEARQLRGSGWDGDLEVREVPMSRTTIDIDDKACENIMRRYGLATKQEAVNFALRNIAPEPLTLDEARQLRGSGWDGDLDEMRGDRLDDFKGLSASAPRQSKVLD